MSGLTPLSRLTRAEAVMITTAAFHRDERELQCLAPREDSGRAYKTFFELAVLFPVPAPSLQCQLVQSILSDDRSKDLNRTLRQIVRFRTAWFVPRIVRCVRLYDSEQASFMPRKVATVSRRVNTHDRQNVSEPRARLALSRHAPSQLRSSVSCQCDLCIPDSGSAPADLRMEQE